MSNIIPVVKKNGEIRVCIDFRNINIVTSKYEYSIPIANLLIDGVARHEILSVIDGHSSYNQIYVVEEDVHKMAFRCLGVLGMYA